jgi:hypothetical protein
MAETLLSSFNPLRLFAASFDLHVTQPILQLRRLMQEENRSKELAIIQRLVHAREAAHYALLNHSKGEKQWS